jgi:hypothetical protein
VPARERYGSTVAFANDLILPKMRRVAIIIYVVANQAAGLPCFKLSFCKFDNP